jgi:cytidylate kinase
MNVVTISRLIGSYGDVIAAVVARRMGLELIGPTQVHEMARKCDPEYSDACSMYEQEHGPRYFERVLFDRPAYVSLFQALTYELAAKGNVLIVGRGSQVILKDIPGVFRARIIAPRDLRVGRIMERYNISLSEADEFVRKSDHEREALIHSVFHTDPNDWALYDLTINTAHYNAASVCDIVVHAVEKIERVCSEVEISENLKKLSLSKYVETHLRKRMTSAVVRQVEVSADSEGSISISGKVRTNSEKQKILQLASQYPGVTRVDDKLGVTDISLEY